MVQSSCGKKDELVVNVHDAKTHFSKLLRSVQSGQEVIIAKASKPIARIAISNPDTEVFISIVSAWEIQQSHRGGFAMVTKDEVISSYGVSVLW